MRTGTSNPAICARSFGGVARNVAENLASLGTSVASCSVIGNDEDGRTLVEHLRAAGVDVSGVVFSGAYPTPQYAAIIGPDGELFSGASDMRAIEGVTSVDLEQWLTISVEAAWIFLDCNLPAAALQAFIGARSASEWRLAVDGTSVAKAQRLPRDLSKVDLLFVNEDEWTAIGRTSARATVILRGANGALVIPSPSTALLTQRAQDKLDVEGSASKLCLDIPAPNASPIDTTGAGDALIAGTLHALLRGDGVESAVRAGTQLAARTIERHGAVPTLR